jgi:hypothetical protein
MASAAAVSVARTSNELLGTGTPGSAGQDAEAQRIHTQAGDPVRRSMKRRVVDSRPSFLLCAGVPAVGRFP